MPTELGNGGGTTPPLQDVFGTAEGAAMEFEVVVDGNDELAVTTATSNGAIPSGDATPFARNRQPTCMIP